MFRSFVLEQYFLDEIFFYLDCRNELNHGAGLHKGLGGADPIVYVRMEHAISVVETRLAKYDQATIDKIKTMIVSKRKVKNNHSLIDCNFILKILLEVYSIEKKKSEKIFQESFTSRGKDSRISFVDFHIFMTKNFKFLTSSEISRLYR